MQGTVATASIMRAAVLASALVAIACTGNPPAGSASYKTGSLGNGGFVFACTDGVACDEFSTGFAANFPQDGVALGSTFNIYFVPKDDQDQPAFSTPSDAIGVTVSGLEPFFNGGPEGITANIREGYGAIVAEQANATVVDFISLQVVKPASITIYNATATGNDATDVGATFSLKQGESHPFRAVAKSQAGAILAGSLNSSWKSADETIFAVATSAGVATLSGLKAGTANLTLLSATLTRTLAVTVTP